MNAIAQTLDAARLLIERGWHQGCYFKPTREDAVSVCAMGGLSLASGNEDQIEDAAIGWLSAAVGLRFENSSSVIAWNDTPGRTQAEVVEGFKRAAELARAA